MCGGQVMISRNYRGDIDMAFIEKFLPLLNEKEEEGNVTPLLSTLGVTFAYVKFNSLYRKCLEIVCSIDIAFDKTCLRLIH
jgi:hypothetical protein